MPYTNIVVKIVTEEDYYHIRNINFPYFLSHYKILGCLVNKGNKAYIHFKKCESMSL